MSFGKFHIYRWFLWSNSFASRVEFIRFRMHFKFDPLFAFYAAAAQRPKCLRCDGRGRKIHRLLLLTERKKVSVGAIFPFSSFRTSLMVGGNAALDRTTRLFGRLFCKNDQTNGMNIVVIGWRSPSPSSTHFLIIVSVFGPQIFGRLRSKRPAN